MADAGSAVFTAVANFNRLRREAKGTARDLRDLRTSARDAGKETERTFGKQVQENIRKTREETKKTQDQIGKTKIPPIRVEVDATAARAKILELQERLKRVKGDLNVDVDTGLAKAKLAELERRLKTLGPGRVNVDVDTARAIGQLKAFEKLADSLDVNIDTDTEGAQQGLSGLIAKFRQATGEGGRLSGAVADNAGQLRSLAASALLVVTSLTALKIPVLIAGLGLAVGVVGDLTAGLFGLASVLVDISGLLPAVGVGISALLQGAGTIFAASKGIGDAIKGFFADEETAGKAAQTAGKAATTSARQQENAAEAVADAQRNLEDTQRSVSQSIVSAHERVAEAATRVGEAEEQSRRAIESAARGVGDAEKSLARAQERAAESQENLNRARRDAIENLQDLSRAVRQNALDQEEAELRLAQARREKEDVQQVFGSPDLDASFQVQVKRAEADFAVRDAELALEDIIDRRQDQEAELADAQAKGVDSADNVVSAQRDLRDSLESVADAQQNLVDAQRALSDAQLDGAKSVAAAQKDLATAQRDLIQTQEDGARRIEDAQRGIERAMRSGVDAAESLGSAGAASVSKFEQAMAKLPPAAQDFVRALLEFREPLKQLRAVAAENLFPGLTAGLKLLRPLFDDIIPIVARTARVLGDLGFRAAELVSSPAWRSDIRKLGEGNAVILGILGDAALALLDVFRNLAVAAQPLAQWLAELIKKWAESAREATNAGREAGTLQGFFERTRETVGKLIAIVSNLWGAFRNLFSVARPLGQWILDNLVAITQQFEDFTGKVETKTAFAEWLEKSKRGLEAIARLLGAAGKSLGFLAGANQGEVSPVADALREKLVPALQDLFASNDGQFLVTIVDLLTALTKFVQVFLTAVPALTLLLKFLAWVLEAAVDLKEALGPVGDLLVTILGIVSAAGLIGGLANIFGILFKISRLGKGFDLLAKSFKAIKLLAAGELFTGAGPLLGGEKAAGPSLASRAAPALAGVTGAGAAAATVGGAVAAVDLHATITDLIDAESLPDLILKILKNIVLNTFLAGWRAVLHIFGVNLGTLIADAVTGAFEWLGSLNIPFGQIFSTILAPAKAVWEGFWNGLRTVVEFVWGIIGGVVQTGIDVVWAIIRIGIAIIAAPWVLLWTVMSEVVSAVWGVIGPVVEAGIGFVSNVIGAVLGIIVGIWNGVWGAILGFVEFVWGVIGPIVEGGIGFVSDVIGSVLDTIATIWRNVWGFIGDFIRPIWDGIHHTVDSVIRRVSDVIGSVLGIISGVWNGVWGSMSGGLDGIWNTIKTIVEGGVNGVLRVIRGLIGGVNWVLEKIGIPTIDTGPLQDIHLNRGGEVKAIRRATGGPIPGYGNTDSVPAWLTPGEYVIRKDAVKSIGVRNLDVLNRRRVGERRAKVSASGPPQLGLGGLVDVLKDAVGVGGDILGGGFNVLTDVAEAAKGRLDEVLSGAALAVFNTVKDGALGLLGPLPPLLEDLVRGMAKWLFEQIGGKIGEKDEEKKAALAASGGGGGVDIGGMTEAGMAMVAAVLSNFPGARLTSGYRSPAENAATPGSSPTSGHMYGKAGDFVGPSMDAIAAFLRAYPGIKMVLWQVAGHYDHVHGEVMHAGGAVDRRNLKANEVVKTLHSSEAVLSGDDVNRLANLGGLAALTGPETGLMGTSLRTTSHDTVIDSSTPTSLEVTINNPVGESSDDSIARTVRKLSFQGLL